MDTGGGTILERLQAAAHGPKLYHATRIVLEASLDPPGGSPPAEYWGSGVSPTDGWQEFLGPGPVFEAREYERLGRWQQSAYHGAPERMNEYTLLAAEAKRLLPFYLESPLTDGLNPQRDRDVWMFGLYFLAMGHTHSFGFDVFGAPPYEYVVETGEQLKWIFARPAGGADQDERALAGFRERYYGAFGAGPRFVYATLRQEVFSASVMALRYLVENRDGWYSSPDALTALIQSAEVELPGRPAERNNRGTRGQDQADVPVRRPNEDRDRWIYDECVKGTSYAKIRAELNGMAKSKGWASASSVAVIYQAMIRYVRRYNLMRPVRRKDP